MYGYLLSYANQIVDINGKPLVGGHIEVFVHNTTTKYITKKDFDGTDNPFKVYLNDRGMAVIIADDVSTYDVYCYDQFNNLFWSRQKVKPGEDGVLKHMLWIHALEDEEDDEQLNFETDTYAGIGPMEDDDLEEIYLQPVFSSNVLFDDEEEEIEFTEFQY